jgi:predicted extracellular nuclease
MTKSTALTVSIICILLTKLSCSQYTSPENRTIAFYNVENLFDTLDTPDKNDSEYLPSSSKKWNTERYNEKLSHINTVFGVLNNPIIIGLCEIENEAVVRDVVENGSMKSTHGVVHFECLDMRGIDNAIIYDSTVLTMMESGFIRFDMPGNSSPSRDIVWAKFKQGNTVILAMVNHWPSRRGGQIESEPKRLIAATAAKAFVDSVLIADPIAKIVFMGDLNDYPDNRAPQMISKSLKSMITADSGKFGGSHNYRGEWNVLDHIMVSSNFIKKKGIHVKKKSGIIHSDKFLLDTYKGNIVPFRTYGGKKYLAGYSDHLPVSIEIGIKP